jgi:hypothetical protein
MPHENMREIVDLTVVGLRARRPFSGHTPPLASVAAMVAAALVSTSMEHACR